MKTLIKIFVLFFSFGLFFSCGDDTEEINRYKNEYRDPKLIGEWYRLGIEHLDYETIPKFTKEGEWRILTTYDSGEKKERFYAYYYTKGNVIYSFVPRNSFKESSSSYRTHYEIKNDTLKIFFGSSPEVYVKKGSI